MSGYNKSIIVGRIASDLAIKQTNSGTQVMSFTVAVGRPKRQNEEEQTDFIQVVAWKETASFIEGYFHKGDWILVEGSIQTRNYETRTGEKRTAFEIVARNVNFVGDKRKEGQSPEQQYSPHKASVQFEEVNIDDDDLPF